MSSKPAGDLTHAIDQMCPQQSCLALNEGRRLSARLLRQQIPETSALPASADILFVYHVGGEAHVERWYDRSISASGSAPGTVTVLPRGRSSGWRFPKAVEVLHLYLPGDLVDVVAERDFDMDPARVEIVDTFAEQDHRGAALAKAALASFGDVTCSALLLDALAQALAIHLLSRHAVLPRPLVRRGTRPNALSAERLARVRDYIEAHLPEEINLEGLAAAACLSAFHFSRCFRAATGETPHAYVMRRRIERSRDLLRDGSLPLAHIAYACGFASQSHFTSSFKGRIGTTPGGYRRQIAG